MIDPVSALPDRAGSMPGTIRRVLTVAVLIGSLVGCGSSPSTAGQQAVDVSATGVADVPKLLQFTAPLVGGGKFAGADHAGRATAFWFWAPT